MYKIFKTLAILSITLFIFSCNDINEPDIDMNKIKYNQLDTINYLSRSDNDFHIILKK